MKVGVLIAVVVVLALGVSVLGYFLVLKQASPIGDRDLELLARQQPAGTTSPSATAQQSPPPAESPPITTPANKPTTKSAPTMTIDINKTYTATLETSAGEITVALNAKTTPITVNNFVTLARQGFYNNTVFHRVLKDFMIQGGDPTGTGRGDPGYKFADEPIVGEYARGTLAMANAGPNTNGSQFFIMHGDVPLQKNYVIFGRVTAGMDTVDKIATAPVALSDGGEMSRPVAPVTVKSVVVKEQ